MRFEEWDKGKERERNGGKNKEQRQMDEWKNKGNRTCLRNERKERERNKEQREEWK